MRWSVWGPASLEPEVVEAAYWSTSTSGALVFFDAGDAPLAAFSSWAWSRVTLDPPEEDVPGDVELAVSGAV